MTVAYCEVYYVVVNGVEKNWRTRKRDAEYRIWQLRQKYGDYNVWLRPRFELVAA